MLAEQITAWSALAYSLAVVVYLVLAWALVQVGWKFTTWVVEQRAKLEQEVESDGATESKL